MLVFTGCRPVKNLFTPPAEIQAKKLLSMAEKSVPAFHTFSARAKVSAETPSFSQNATAHIRMITDSLIWISITYMFGIELGRMYIFPDSVVLLDKLRKQYYVYPFVWLKSWTAVPEMDISVLQKILTGQLWMKADELQQFKKSENSFVFTVKDPYKKIEFYLGKTFPYLQSCKVVSLVDNFRSETRYSGIINSSERKIPQNVEIIAYLPEKNKLTLTYKDVVIDEKMNLDTSIPQNYELQK